MFRRGTKFGIMEQGEPVSWGDEGVVLGMWGLIQLAMGDGELGTGPERGAIAEGGKERDEEQYEGDDEEMGEEGSGGVG